MFYTFTTSLSVARIRIESESEGTCSVAEGAKNDCIDGSSKDWLGIIIVFIGIVLIGIGNACILSLGIPYIDDNSQKNGSPLSLSLGFAARISGPAIGYGIGYFSLKVFVNPSEVPEGTYNQLYFLSFYRIKKSII